MSYQSVIRTFAASLVDLCDRVDTIPPKPHSVLNRCIICKEPFVSPAHDDNLCDECSERVTVQSPILKTLDEPFSDVVELTDADIVACDAA